jgi:branched-chain amino acid transport system substrate-binding protein
MGLTRRDTMLGSAAILAGAGSLARPAIAQSEPLRIGWLAALTGPSSAPGIGFDRGVKYAVETINASGGVKGRKIDLVVRDTQGDPTKAVNAVQDMISRQKVHAIWGPTNSGEALATTPIMARAKMPDVHPCFVDTLIDVEKYPSAFRMAPSNAQIDIAVASYGVDRLKVKKVAIVGDTTGYGVTTVKSDSAAFQKMGADVVYSGEIDATQPDVSPDMLRMRNAGAEVIVFWSVNTGLASRIMNTRATMNWSVPIIGHPALGTGEIGKLVAKPENWDNVYMLGFKNCSYRADGTLPEPTQGFVERIRGKIELADTNLWWVALGTDAINVIAKAVGDTGSVEADAIVGYWNKVTKYPGYYATYTWTPEQHNGLPQDDLVMSVANTQREGAFKLAPGYV